MRIVWFSWKDLSHPLAGGAEVLGSELIKGLLRDGHEVVHIVGGYKNCQEQSVDGALTIHRVGNRFTVYWAAYKLFREKYGDWADAIVEEVNTVPFFTNFYTKCPRLLVIHQLARSVWFFQMPFPFSVVGYLLEPIYLRFLGTSPIATISESSRNDLVRHGFDAKRIRIYGVGIESTPMGSFDPNLKDDRPTILSLGSVRPMKRTADVFTAFCHAKPLFPELRLVIAGDSSGPYGEKLLKRIQKSPFQKDVEILGRVTQAAKLELMRKAHFVVITSIKEGWGLVVTEANSQGTPAIVYNVDGLRDSVRHGLTGFVVQSGNTKRLAEQIVDATKDLEGYQKICDAALSWSREITFERGYKEFREILELAIRTKNAK